MVLVNNCGNGFHSLSLECVHERARVFAPNEPISSNQITRITVKQLQSRKIFSLYILYGKLRPILYIQLPSWKWTEFPSNRFDRYFKPVCWHSCPRMLGSLNIVSWRSLKMQFLVHSRSDNGLQSLINLINEMSYAENSVCHVSFVFIVWFCWTQTVVISSISVFYFIYMLS